jgi:hypothetical protein
LEELDDLSPDSVGEGAGNPVAEAEEVEVELGVGLVAEGGDSDDEGLAVGGELRGGGVEVVDVGGEPIGEVGGLEGGGGDEEAGGGVEELNGPGSGGVSGDLGVDFEGHSADELKVLSVGAGGEVKESGVVKVGGVGDAGDVRVGVLVVSDLVGESEGGESSHVGDARGTGGGDELVGDGSSGVGDQRIDLSSNLSEGSVDQIVKEAVVDVEEVVVDRDVGELAVVEEAREGGGGDGGVGLGAVGGAVDGDEGGSGRVVDDSAVEEGGGGHLGVLGDDIQRGGVGLEGGDIDRGKAESDGC